MSLLGHVHYITMQYSAIIENSLYSKYISAMNSDIENMDKSI